LRLRGTLDDRSEQALTSVSTFLLKLNPASPAVATAQQYALAQVSAMASARAERESAAETRLPGGLLAAAIATSAIVCLFRSPAGYGQPACVSPWPPCRRPWWRSASS
jgi:hypothetical protein